MIQRFHCAIPVLLLVSSLAVGGIRIDERFKQRWQAEKVSPMSDIPAATVANLVDRHVVFVAGILNELTSCPQWFGGTNSYFINNISAVKQLGMTYSWVGPSSAESFEDDAEDLYREIMGDKELGKLGIYAENGGKPIILFAHSMGGATSLRLVLTHPSLIWDGVIDRVILIEPAIGGSPMASQKELSWVARLGSQFFRPSLDSLTSEHAKTSFVSAVDSFMGYLSGFESDAERAEKFGTVHSKIFYVRSEASPELLSFGVQWVQMICGTSLARFGAGDGLILSKDQKLNGLGIDLGVTHGDHFGQTVGYFSNRSIFSIWSRETIRLQEAFTRAVLAQAYDLTQFEGCQIGVSWANDTG